MTLNAHAGQKVSLLFTLEAAQGVSLRIDEVSLGATHQGIVRVALPFGNFQPLRPSALM